jgi:hypothetical protein
MNVVCHAIEGKHFTFVTDYFVRDAAVEVPLNLRGYPSGAAVSRPDEMDVVLDFGSLHAYRPLKPLWDRFEPIVAQRRFDVVTSQCFAGQRSSP